MTLEGIRPLENKLMLRAEEQVNWRTNRKWGRSLENHLFPSAANNQRPVAVCRGDGTASVFLIKPPTIVLLITDLQKAGYLALCLQLPDKKTGTLLYNWHNWLVGKKCIRPGVSSPTLERCWCPFVTSPRAYRQNLPFCPFLRSVRRCEGWTHSLARRHWRSFVFA